MKLVKRSLHSFRRAMGDSHLQVEIDSPNSAFELTSSRSHVEVVFHPSITDGSWKEIDELGIQVIEELKQRRTPVCLFDLTQIEYMGSSVVAVLVRICKQINEQRGKMAVVIRHPVVNEIIQLAGLDKIWPIYPTVEAARKSLGVPAFPSEESLFSSKVVRVVIFVLIFLALALVTFSFIRAN